ncbi:MAG: BBP7 family outer membrane beta-barrel protein [Planctomycetota bacterium]
MVLGVVVGAMSPLQSLFAQDAPSTIVGDLPQRHGASPLHQAATGQTSNESTLAQVDFVQHSVSDRPFDRCDQHAVDFTQYMPTAATRQSCDPVRRTLCDWYASTDLIFMSRSDEPYALGFSTLGGTAPTIELNHGFTPGVRATLGRRTGSTGHFQISYLGINDWDASNQSTNIPFGGSTLSSVDGYDARLNDLQFNLISMDPYADWDWIFGLRIIDQRDELSSLLTLNDGLGNPNSITTESVIASAGNTLFGGQIGMRYGHRFGPLSIDAAVKGGVFNNRISQKGPIFAGAIVIDGTQEPMYDIDDDEVSFMGDFQARMVYHASQNLHLQFGYQGLIFSNIAQSTRQDGNVSAPEGLAYHGFFTGISLVY